MLIMLFSGLSRNSGTGMRQLRLLLALSTALGTSLGIGPALASPDGPSVVGGRATVTLGATTQVCQNSQRAIIDWRSFSLGRDERFEVLQPNAHALLLNRVTGGQASQIDGTLSANGQVIFINPAGVLIGHNARIDAAGLIATTSDIGNADFMGGILAFTHPSSVVGASVGNAGIINVADDGYVVLSAAMVSNTGAVNARLGSIVLGGVAAFTLDLEGDGLLSYRMPEASVPSAVQNSGSLSAAGGSVLLTVASVRNVIGSVINTDGIIAAQGVRNVGGRIMVVAEGGDVSIGGTLNASSATGQGGSIAIDANTIAVDDATIRADGATGGGAVRIGTMTANADHRAASTVSIGTGAVVSADATVDGNGGHLNFLSAATTRFDGQGSARGAGSGNGGTAEISSAQKLQLTGFVDLTAQAGLVGTLLLDPVNIRIISGNSFDDNYTADTQIGTGYLLGQLAVADLTISTTDRQGPVPGSIFIYAPINYTGSAARNLTFVSTADINVSANITSSNAPLNVQFNLGSGGGSLNLDSDVAVLSGNISVFSNNSLNVVASSATSVAANSIVLGANGSASGSEFRIVTLGAFTNFVPLAFNGNFTVESGIGVNLQSAVAASGNIDIQTAGSLSIHDQVAAGGNIFMRSGGGAGFYIDSTASITASSASNPQIVLVGVNGFQNMAGSAAVSAPNGRYLIYVPSYNSETTTLGGLGGTPLYNHIYDGPEVIGGSGNRLIFSQEAFATVTVNNATRQSGQAGAFSSTVTGLVNGDTRASFGTILYQTTGAGVLNVGFYTIAAQALNPLNYTITYVPGTLTVTEAALGGSGTGGSSLPVSVTAPPPIVAPVFTVLSPVVGGSSSGTSAPPAGAPIASGATATVLNQTLSVASVDGALVVLADPASTSGAAGGNASETDQTADRDGALPVQQGDSQAASTDGTASASSAKTDVKAVPPPEGDTPPPREDGASGNSEDDAPKPVIPGVLSQVARTGSSVGGVAGLLQNFPDLGRAW